MESCSGQSWPQMISIHALREEGDASPVQPLRMVGNFYPRPPRGGRPVQKFIDDFRKAFLSTPSARRATMQRCPPGGLPGDFYPRPPRGGRHPPLGVMCAAFRISIHALREEGDLMVQRPACALANFYPRPPRGGRRGGFGVGCRLQIISIHALREEGDSRWSASWSRAQNFYPRPPRGGRRADVLYPLDHPRISIHALREEGDRFFLGCNGTQLLFLSTPSARRATKSMVIVDGSRSLFLSTPSARRATRSAHCFPLALIISIHALREEGDS